MLTRSRSYCDACGSAQASHFSLWLDNLTDAISLRVPLHRFPFYGALMSLAGFILSVLGQLSFFAGRGLLAVSLSNDPETAVSDRSKLLWREAKRRNMDMKQVMLFGSATDTFRVRYAGRTEFFTSLPLSPEPSALSMDDKVLFKAAMSSAGLPVPQSYGVSTFSDARRALSAVTVACVKPRTGSNGRHTYPHVRTEDELSNAYRSVRKIAPFVTIEASLEGNLCRASCVGGTMIGFLECFYPTIVGDGLSTIEELVANANTKKKDRIKDIVLDEVNEGYINRRGYSRDSVLPKGTALALSYRAGMGAGGRNREHGRAIHPSFIPLIEQAARLTCLHIVGFDLIIPDPQQPADSQTWGFIEANSLPWTDLHMAAYEGEKIDLSPAIWDFWTTKTRPRALRPSTSRAA